jgi:dTDP-4-dehydrorhamnose reductase
MKILVLGASGMLGNAVFRVMSEDTNHQVYATVRSDSVKRHFSADLAKNILSGINVESNDALERLFLDIKPEVVINCIGLVKQLADVDDPLVALPINSILPHRLARLSALVNARLVHISTDCVFSGKQGRYLESDEPDAQDLYGRSKLIGEVTYQHTITLRTSIIGRELTSSHGLVDWFLSQQGPVKGFTHAIFSGLPTCELALVIRDYVLNKPHLSGLYHVASKPISKYDLLNLVNHTYKKNISILANDALKIDRSLNGERFIAETGYAPPPWEELVEKMYAFN